MPSRNVKPKRKQPKAVPASRVFEVFAGCMVTIVTGQSQGGEDGAVVLQLKGYFLDVDEEFIYVGESPIEVAAAVRRDCIVAITVDNSDIPDTGDMQ